MVGLTLDILLLTRILVAFNESISKSAVSSLFCTLLPHYILYSRELDNPGYIYSMRGRCDYPGTLNKEGLLD